MAHNQVPPSPEALLARLREIFPTFAPEPPDPAYGESLTFHFIMKDFTVFFGPEAQLASSKQLRELGALLNDATARPGELENAVDTCFLEHLHQIQAEKVLRPYLAEAKRHTRHA